MVPQKKRRSWVSGWFEQELNQKTSRGQSATLLQCCLFFSFCPLLQSLTSRPSSVSLHVCFLLPAVRCSVLLLPMGQYHSSWVVCPWFKRPAHANQHPFIAVINSWERGSNWLALSPVSASSPLSQHGEGPHVTNMAATPNPQPPGRILRRGAQRLLCITVDLI